MGLGKTKADNNKKIFISKDVHFFGGLYEQYYSNMVIFAESIIYDRDEAKDIVQDVFADLWNQPNKVHVYNSMKTYLYSCVKNKAFNRLKKLNIIDRHQDLLNEAYLFAGETQTHTNEKLIKQIHEVIANMPEKMKEVLTMHVIQEMKYTEISEDLGISVNSVKTHLKRAYKRFRKEVNSKTLIAFLSFILIRLFNN